MEEWKFSCNKCNRNFSVVANEGTKVKCYDCNNLMNVPVYDGLSPINILGETDVEESSNVIYSDNNVTIIEDEEVHDGIDLAILIFNKYVRPAIRKAINDVS